MEDNKTYVLGLSAYYHDSAAALLRDGVVVAAAAEERFSHVRHDAAFPQMAAEWCLAQAGITAGELSAVVFYEDTALKFSRILVSALAAFPHGAGFFLSAMQRWLPGQLWVKARICSALGVHPRQVQQVSHHLSHASHAFFNSPFDEAAIITVDAVGEWVCTSIARGDRNASKPIELVYEQTYPASLGLFYAAMTAYLGFQPNCDECSTMALAAYGQPRYRDELLALLRYDPARPGYLDLALLDIERLKPGEYHPRLLGVLGAPRPANRAPGFDLLAGNGAADADDQRYADIASSVQSVLETVLEDLVAHAATLTGASRFCITGGVANNCVAIGKLVARYGAGSVYVPLDPGDGGSAVGAAMVGHYRAARRRPQPMATALTGPEPGSAGLADLLAAYSEKHPGLGWVTHTDEASLMAATASHLAAGQLVGWVQGRGEFGPRALGARSILAHPGRRDSARRLSLAVKRRAGFRPYGVSMTERQALQSLQLGGIVPAPARYMQMAVPVAAGHREALAAVLASDGTTRPQVCREQESPRLHRLLEAVGRETGSEALLNTSFNIPGYPIVNNALDALTAFLHMGLDVLVVGNLLVERKSR